MPDRAVDPGEVVASLFMLPAFTEQVSRQDRRWHSAPGTDFVPLAFELGIKQITTRQGKVMRMPGAVAPVVDSLSPRFEEHFGRPSGPDDPLFFDPDQKEPTAMSIADVERHQIDLLEVAGIHPAWIYACQQTRGLMPMPDGGFATANDETEWRGAVEIELQKIRNMAAISMVGSAAHDAELAAGLLQQLDASAAGSETDKPMSSLSSWSTTFRSSWSPSRPSQAA